MTDKHKYEALTLDMVNQTDMKHPPLEFMFLTLRGDFIAEMFEPEAMPVAGEIFKLKCVSTDNKEARFQLVKETPHAQGGCPTCGSDIDKMQGTGVAIKYAGHGVSLCGKCGTVYCADISKNYKPKKEGDVK